MSAAAVAQVLERAALDGSTCVPVDVVSAALRSAGVADTEAAALAAVESGAAVGHDGLLGHPHWAAVERRVAEVLRAVAGAGGLTVVDAPRGTDPGPMESGTRVVERADLLSLADAEKLAEPAGMGLVLVGDPAMPPAPGPGAVLTDVVDSGVATVVDAPAVAAPGPLAELVHALRTGVLPTLSRDQREVVVTSADDAEQALRRVVQLGTDSIPRVFGLDTADVLVLTVRADGRTGAETVRAELDTAGASDIEVRTCAEAVGRAADAIVLVLGAEAAGSLSGDLLVGAATEARRHLSVVHQTGPALAEAVARRPHRHRRTLLPRLLAGGESG